MQSMIKFARFIAFDNKHDPEWDEKSKVDSEVLSKAVTEAQEQLLEQQPDADIN